MEMKRECKSKKKRKEKEKNLNAAVGSKQEPGATCRPLDL